MSARRDFARDYLEELDRALAAHDVPDRTDIVSEIGSHISEAVRSGKDVDAVVRRLGPPEHLARAYAANSMLGDDRVHITLPHLRAAALLATTSFASLMVIPVLLIIAIGLPLTGALSIVIGLAALVLSPSAVQIEPPTYEAAAAAIAIGVALIGIGVLAWRGLRAYVPVAASAIKKSALHL